MAFHPYPQLIPSVFNLSGFAPPRRLTIASHWSWVDHSASGPGHATTTRSLAFAFATATPPGLTSRHAADSQAHSAKGTPSPHKKALTDCKHTVSGTISLPSRGTFHHSLTVLIHYRSQKVFRLTEWSRQIHSRFHEPAATREHHQRTHCMLSRTGLSPSTAGHSKPLPLTHHTQEGVTSHPTPRPHNTTHATPSKSHTHMV